MNKKDLIPLCPDCDGLMTERRGRNGAFWGCLKFPACRGTRNIGDNGDAPMPAATPSSASKPAPRGRKPVTRAEYDAIPIMPGSEEQERIWEFMATSNAHGVIKAFAGTGKTHTSIQGILRNPKKSTVVVAFNKHIEVEANGKLRASRCYNASARTYHGLGLSMIRVVFPNTQVDQYKVATILEKIPMPSRMTASVWGQTLSLAGKLVDYCKNYLLDPNDADFIARLEEIADHHSVELNGIGAHAIDLLPGVLSECKRQAATSIDFNDMVWLPVVLGLQAPTSPELLIVDEAQDTNLCQQELAMLACPKGRIIIVGDPYQAIYGFRGADVTAMPRMKERLAGTPRGCEEMTLSITRRCPKSHVRLAQSIVPDIKAMPDAPEGEILSMGEAEAAAALVPGDMVLCRVNAKLIPLAYTLLRRGIKPVVRGKDIGQGLTRLVEKLEKKATNIPAMVVALQQYRRMELERLEPLGDKAAGRIGALNDKCDCLGEMLSESESIPELKANIESLFADFGDDGKPKGAVVLGTVHRTKGLEATRIFVLEPRLLPHPMAKKPWEHVQESNLAYVAVTRAKYNSDVQGTIVFVGAVPGIYNYTPGIDPEPETVATGLGDGEWTDELAAADDDLPPWVTTEQ